MIQSIPHVHTLYGGFQLSFLLIWIHLEPQQKGTRLVQNLNYLNYVESYWLDEPVLTPVPLARERVPVPEPMLTVSEIHYILESCARLLDWLGNVLHP